MNNIILNLRWFFILVFLFGQSSCRKLVESPPPTEIVAGSSAYASDATAIAVLNGIYISMNAAGSGQLFQGNNSIGLFAGLTADELTLYSGVSNSTHLAHYLNSLTVAPGVSIGGGSQDWAPLYNYIFKCNAAIEGLTTSKSLTIIVKQQLLGEAKFLRAFFYFYLVNLFGDVPLVLGTDPQINLNLPRASKAQVYQQIVLDLQEAEEKLSQDFLTHTLVSNTVERVRPTKWAATALLARAYLFNGNLTGDASNYAKAEDRSTAVINNTSLFGPLPTLNNAFLKNSREAIWQIQPTTINFNTEEAKTMVIPVNGPNSISNPVYLSKNLLNSFEPGDQRKTFGNWVDTTIYKISSTPLVWDTVAYTYKYKVNNANTAITTVSGTQFMTEYFMVLRLGEQYLIRAEARAQQGNIGGAQTDLNAIRNRAGLGNTTAGDKNSLLNAILKERQVELFCEWGHRWFDLKRTNNVDAVMNVITPLKSNGSTFWQPFQALYPLPLTELQRAPNLVQNPGY